MVTEWFFVKEKSFVSKDAKKALGHTGWRNSQHINYKKIALLRAVCVLQWYLWLDAWEGFKNKKYQIHLELSDSVCCCCYHTLILTRDQDSLPDDLP